MLSGSPFPRRPHGVLPAPTPVVRVLRHRPLAAIRELLAVSLHDVINDRALRARVHDFYRVTRWIENERWLRRQLESS